jgi:hypothetical protein
MDINRKIERLQKILNKANDVKIESCSDSSFIIWKSLTERALMNIYSTNSHELKEFKNLAFCYGSEDWYSDKDYTNEHLIEFRKDFKIAKDLIQNYIEEFKDEIPINEENILEVPKDMIQKKIFISHSSKDSDIVEELINVLETIGLKSSSIFCTSFGEYGISLGENFLERIKNELSENDLVLFLISDNFYSSPVCLCEMGATWVQSKVHIPILVPPFKFEQIKGVIPLSQGIYIDNSKDLNLLKENIEESFSIDNKMKFSSWERKRDRILERIKIIIAQVNN